MRLSIDNIGKIKNAQININGVCIIAGVNNTGKSTMGKSLFSAFSSLFDIDKKIEDEKVDALQATINRNLINISTNKFRFKDSRIYFINRVFSEKFIKDVINILNKEDFKELTKDKINNVIIKHFNDFLNRNYKDLGVEKNFIDSYIDDISASFLDILSVDKRVFQDSLVTKALNSEFNNQINNINSDNIGKIVLSLKDNDIQIDVKNNKATLKDTNVNIFSECVYIDNPFIIDDLNSHAYYPYRESFFNGFLDHRSHLYKKLSGMNKKNTVEQIVVNNKISDILNKLNTVVGGTIYNNGSNYVYSNDNFKEGLDIRNLSAGLKTFAIIKMLLLNGAIEENGLIILDEPEIHLHPKWQLVFAEIIVLLQKEFGLHILLNTHSPYFLNAIEVYSQVHGIEDKCNYYLASNNGKFAELKEIVGSLEEIYDLLAEPFQDLENIKYRDED